MDLRREMRTFIITGCVVAIVCAIPIGFFVGIGGTVVSAVVGILATCVIGIIRNRVAQNAQQTLEGQTQIQGVLDSSQLGKGEGEPASQEVVPFARHGKLVAAAISLAFCLVTAGIVGAATNGVGINFYLGAAPQVSTNKNASSTSSSTKRTTKDTQEQSQNDNTYGDTVETWYPPEEEVPQNTGAGQQQSSPEPSPSSSSSSPSQNSSTNPSPSPSGGNQSSEGQGSGNTPSPSAPSSEPSTPTQAPTNSGTINDVSQNAKEQ